MTLTIPEKSLRRICTNKAACHLVSLVVLQDSGVVDSVQWLAIVAYASEDACASWSPPSGRAIPSLARFILSNTAKGRDGEPL